MAQLFLYKGALFGMYKERVLEKPFLIGGQHLPESCKIGVIGFVYLYYVFNIIVCTMVMIKMNTAIVPGDAVEAATGIFIADVYIEFFLHGRQK